MTTTSALRDVVVVGSGPNGLAAAVTLARAGLAVTVVEGQPEPGGGVRTLPLVSDRVGPDEGLLRDVCAAVPAAAPTSPFFAELDLPARGVDLLVPEVSYAQPLDGGRAGVAWRDLARTVEGLGEDGERWRRLVGPLVRHHEDVARIALSDKRSLPVAAVVGGAGAALAAALAVLSTRAGDRWWRTDVAHALITGVAAHTITALPSVAAAGTAAYLGALAHSPSGWPLVRGGIGEITRVLVADLRAHGGQLVVDRPVRGREDLPAARHTLLDTHACVAARMLAEPFRGRLERLPVGAGVCKLDYVLSAPVPWAHPDVARAGTVHVGGSVEQMRQAEAEVAAGRHPDRPVLLVSDPASHDPGRSGRSGLRPLWAYAHVPRGSDRDVRPQAEQQLERFAPGFRDVVVDCVVTPASRMADHNAALVDGDISGGAVSMWRMVARPGPRPDPYAVAPGVWLCSSSVPPGPGVHGMGGHHAARRVLRELGLPVPSLAPGR
ncbi:phytoene desaturase family protein [Ornithinimicrobium avium]|uniref:NAD(P)/FAD-dependent oxidoreductase n=1 Tax=Ornithinimicrobium avium TaxID=2283195 RepID=A0A345NJ63_9MICO|nr:NAD(P)/FAD-dependent oxidoreductase [Ornithinimicrobium avium]AXH95071.1 NAD(P)/FAD-dependent oxidoreductase [Ornithinimicrobium avium]